LARGIECPVKVLGGELHVRVTAALYNERADYEALAEAVSGMPEAARTGELGDIP
jgi:hypothetical protein